MIAFAAVASLSVASAAEPQPVKNRHAPVPASVQPSEGISWPKGQALPHFAAPSATLDAVEVQSLSADEQLTFSALQGQVNRKRPRILLLDARTDEGRDTWANTKTISLGARNVFERANRYGLLAKYADEVSGLVLYDSSRSPHLRNLAATVAAIRHALPATAEIRRRLQARGIELKVVADLTALDLASSLEVYRHLYDNYWKDCDKRLIVSARPDARGGDLHHTRDLAAACGAAALWLDSRNPAEKALLRKFFGDMRAGEAVVLGWYPTERSGIVTASEFGIGTIAADHYLNASVFAGLDHHIAIPPVPKRAPLAAKAYIAIYISDGDNIQYAQRAMRRIWDRSASSRGKVAMNWTIAPGLVDVGPGLLNYYYTTATHQDCFVAGPSGMGYLMPVNTLNEPGAAIGRYLTDIARMDAYARLTETYLQRSGLRVATVWDDATPEQRASYSTACRSLYGATVQNFKDVPAVTASVADGRVRFDKLVIPYVGSFRHLSDSLDGELRKWDGKSPLFLSYQVAVWNEMKPNRIVELAEQINKQHANVEFVRADHYFNLYNEAHGLPFNLAMSASTTIRSSDAASQPQAAIDGTSATAWTTRATGAKWLEIDLGKAYRLTRYVIRFASPNDAGGPRAAPDYAVQVSNDETTWTMADNRRGAADDTVDATISAVDARYLKFTFADAGAASTTRVAEAEVFGTTK
jgi:hypothetical protein